MNTDFDFQMNRGLLILFDDFDTGLDKNVEPFQYCTGDKNLMEIRQKYGVEDVAGNGNELSKVLNLLDWISTSISHKGNITEDIAMNTIALMDYSYQKGKENGINCRMKATVLTEMLLSIGIISRILSLQPLNPNDPDNHVVSQVWLSEKKKWIIVDPTTNSYFMDENGEILNAIELRENIIFGNEIICSPKTSFGGETNNSDPYLTYMAKNLFYMHSPVINSFGSEDREDQKWITLCPKEFNGSKRDEIRFIQIEENLKRGKSWNEDMEKRINAMKNKIKNHDFMYTNSVDSFMVPIIQPGENRLTSTCTRLLGIQPVKMGIGTQSLVLFSPLVCIPLKKW